MHRMQPAELAEYLKTAKPLLLDVREVWEFEICHLPGSINIPMDQIADNLDRIRSAKECIVICHHGLRSLRAIQFLQQHAYDDTINLEGGIDAWARQVDPKIPLY